MISEIPAWMGELDPEDLSFIRRFVLASGSLKEMAEQYEVSYPTIRSRLDALIAKIEQASAEQPESAVKRVVRELVGSGEIDINAARRLIAADNKDRKAQRSK